MKPVRLPKHVSPERYQILIKPNIEAFVFSGEEKIFFKLTKATSQITLHSKDLDITSAHIGSAKAKISYNLKAETATFTFTKTLRPGKHQLKLFFTGVILDALHGFYRSTYQHKGKTKFLATTQFEPTDARRAFPCFDEPAHKAVFDITLMVPQHLTAISNTIETDIIQQGEYKIVKFAPTPKMSTYLVAYIVGDFEFIQGKTKNATVVRIFTTPGKKHQAQFALDVAIKTLEFYEKYFNIPYPLPVLDLIALPDFSAAAMENWGAITYRETALLVDETHTPRARKQAVVEVITHELAHQWFGNLVTMEWWTHLWLNESFATYMSYFVADKLFPKWDIWSKFTFHIMNWGYELDALQTTHPIEIEVHHPSEIEEIFDGISYAKGASLMRMLADYIGENDFQSGLRRYLSKHSYKNTSTVDLWRALEKASGKPIEKIMSAWIKKPGFPLVSVARRGKTLVFDQTRMFSSRLTKTKTRDKSIWPIPIKISTENKTAYVMLDRKQKPTPSTFTKFVKLNSGEVGFYQTKYSGELMAQLGQHASKLTRTDRAGLIRDAFAVAEAGQTSVVEALELVKSFKDERGYTVWAEIIQGLQAVDVLLAHQPLQKKFRQFALQVLSQVRKQIDWTPKAGESDNTVLLRALIINALGSVGDKATIARARKIFSQARKGKLVHPDIRAVVYAITAMNGTKKDFELITKMYLAAEMHEEKDRLARALTLFPQTALINRSINFIFSRHVRLQDSPRYYAAAWYNQKAWAALWIYMQTHWSMLYKRYGQGGRMLGNMIKSLSDFSEPTTVKQIKKFLLTHDVPGGAMAVKQTIEKMESNADWRKRDLPSLIKKGTFDITPKIS